MPVSQNNYESERTLKYNQRKRSVTISLWFINSLFVERASFNGDLTTQQI